MNRLGACSWSLRARTPEELVALLGEVGVEHLQLALDPLRFEGWAAGEAREFFARAGIAVTSGMVGTVGEDYTTLESIRATGGVRPDEHWEQNLANAHAGAAIAGGLGLPLVSFHAGFLPEAPGPERARLIERLRTFADVFAAEGVALALETGQETAETLVEVLQEIEHATLGVNFDPANMILYDQGDPVEALRRLLPWVRQIHVKDAVRARRAGEWGSEVPVGEGEVDWAGFFAVLRDGALTCDLMIEREAGENRVADMRAAADLVRQHLAVKA